MATVESQHDLGTTSEAAAWVSYALRGCVTMYVRNGVMLGGVLYAGRTLATVESQIPDDLGTTSEAAAWVSYALRSHRAELNQSQGEIRRDMG